MKLIATVTAGAALAVMLTAFPAQAALKGCVFYEPGVAKVKGKLRHSTVWTLDLAKPICIEGKENDKTGMYPTLDAVKTIVLLARKETPLENYEALSDKDVVITGTLYHKFDMPADQVMMMVATLRPPPAPPLPPKE